MCILILFVYVGTLWFREFETLFQDRRRAIQSFFWIKDFKVLLSNLYIYCDTRTPDASRIAASLPPFDTKLLGQLKHLLPGNFIFFYFFKLCMYTMAILVVGTKLERFLPKNQHTQRRIGLMGRCQKMSITKKCS